MSIDTVSEDAATLEAAVLRLDDHDDDIISRVFSTQI